MMNNIGVGVGVGVGVGGPCGACKFLRRKCVKGCIFAPYFDPAEQGTFHFAAVHKVFGASNASKLLLRVPPHKRLDAVVTLCYEALSRVRDPVYGCVSHIFALQQQVANLQAELALVQARLSTLQRLPLVTLPPAAAAPAPAMMNLYDQCCTSELGCSIISNQSMHLELPYNNNLQYSSDQQTTTSSMEMTSFCNSSSLVHEEEEEIDDDGDLLHTLARGFPSLKTTTFMPSPSSH